MRKQLIFLLALSLALSLLLSPVFAIDAEQAAPVDYQAKSVLLMERETGSVLYEDNAHQPLPPASVTKVMTMLLVTEAVDSGRLSLDDMVTTSAYAASMGGSQVYLEEGETMSVGDMLKAVAVASGNDAAVALAEHLKGSESAFVDAMNQRAQELGMEDTHFVNCTGLPAEGHLTTAYDIALMSRQLLDHETIRPFVGTWMDTLRGGAFQLANTNKLIHGFDGATGLKTGFTQDAGFCISASAQREGMELIAVVLGSETSKDRFNSAKALLNYGFAGWGMADISPDQPLPPVQVTLGQNESVPVEPECVTRLLLPKDQAGQLTVTTELAEEVQAPVSKGQPMGMLRAYVNEQQVGEVPLVASADVERLTFSQLFRRLLVGML